MPKERSESDFDVLKVAIILALGLVFFATAEFVRVEPVPNRPGYVRVVTDSVTCQPDPREFGRAVPLIEGRVTQAQCDSIMELLKTRPDTKTAE